MTTKQRYALKKMFLWAIVKMVNEDHSFDVEWDEICPVCQDAVKEYKEEWGL